MVTVRYIAVRKPKRPIGKRCMHCGKPATTLAVRKLNGHRMTVRYCEVHAGVILGR